FEFAGTHDYFGGTSIATRRPGLVNINTVWDVEILRALLGNNDAAANTIFNQMIARRTPGLTAATPSIGPTDEYLAAAPPGYSLDSTFRPLSTGSTAPTTVTASGGQYPVATGINSTILRPRTANVDSRVQTDFDSAIGGHPYIRHEWLTKIFNS